MSTGQLNPSPWLLAAIVSEEAITRAWLSDSSEMISVMGGSLGHNKPDDDAVVPAGQGVFLRDWRADALRGTPRAVVPAGELTDGEFIRSLGQQSVTLYILAFDAPHILYVDGMELATELPEPLPHAA